MKRVYLFGFLALALALAACRSPVDQSQAQLAAPLNNKAQAIRIELSGEPQIAESEVLVYVLQTGNGVTGATVSVSGRLAASNTVLFKANALEQYPGLYRVEAFDFSQAGDWILSAEVQFPSGNSGHQELSVTIPE